MEDTSDLGVVQGWGPPSVCQVLILAHSSKEGSFAQFPDLAAAGWRIPLLLPPGLEKEKVNKA